MTLAGNTKQQIVLSWSIGVAVIVGNAAAVALLGESARGIAARVLGALSVLLLMGLLIITYRCALALQHDRIQALGQSMVLQFSASRVILEGLRDLGIDPQWTNRVAALSVDPSGIRFWTGIRRPFLVGALDRASVEDVASVGSRILVQASHEGRSTVLVVESLVVRRWFVARATGETAGEASRKLKALLGLGEA